MTKIRTFLFYLDRSSFYLQAPFWLKFLAFFAVSSIGLFGRNHYVNGTLCVALFLLIGRSGFVRARPRYVAMILFSSMVFCAIWLLLSRVKGATIYATFPWGTYISNRTIDLMLGSLLRWVLICLAGLLLLITCSQEEMIEELIRFHAPYQLILIFTVAFNTISFTLESLPQIQAALGSRNLETRSFTSVFSKIQYIGAAILMDNIRRIAMLRIAYFLEKDDIMRTYGNSRSGNC